MLQTLDRCFTTHACPNPLVLVKHRCWFSEPGAWVGLCLCTHTSSRCCPAANWGHTATPWIPRMQGLVVG